MFKEFTMKLQLLCLIFGTTSSFHLHGQSPVRGPSQLFSEANVEDRRSFLVAGLSTAAAISTWGLQSSPAFAASPVDYKKVSQDIAKLVKEDPDKGPTFVRLAWHSSGTYDKVSKTGGSGGGTIRFKEELSHGGNAGLEVTAVKWLEPIYKKYKKAGLSYADLYTLAGVTSIYEMGGPKIGWSSGRIDEPVEAVTPDGRLPNAESGKPLADKADSDHLRSIFYRMGFDDR